MDIMQNLKRVPFIHLNEEKAPLPDFLKNGEAKRYLLLITLLEEDNKVFEIITGRDEMFNYVKENADVIDFDNSYLVTEKQIWTEAEQLHTIIRLIKDKYFPEDDFNIDEYITKKDINSDTEDESQSEELENGTPVEIYTINNTLDKDEV